MNTDLHYVVVDKNKSRPDQEAHRVSALAIRSSRMRRGRNRIRTRSVAQALIALAQLAAESLAQPEQGRELDTRIVTEHPTSDAARLAKTRLDAA